MKNRNYIPVSHKSLMRSQLTKKNHVQKQRDDKLLSASFNIAILLSAVALRDEFEFGGQRLERFIEKVNDSLDSYNKGYVSVTDFNDMIFEETGIQILDREMLKDENYNYKE